MMTSARSSTGKRGLFGIANATSKNLLVHYILEKETRLAASGYFSGKLLDIGCGLKPYAGLVAPYVSTHIGLDHSLSLHDRAYVDLDGTAYAIPAAADSFDCALCSAVLEHLEEPEAALRECLRILKPGGHAVYTVPFIWHLHEEPRDFYRYTKYGLDYLFTKSGFEVVQIKALSGFWVTFGQLFVYNLHRLNIGPLRWLRIIDVIGLLVQGFAYLLDRLDRSERWTWMYLVVARKPA